MNTKDRNESFADRLDDRALDAVTGGNGGATANGFPFKCPCCGRTHHIILELSMKFIGYYASSTDDCGNILHYNNVRMTPDPANSRVAVTVTVTTYDDKTYEVGFFT